MRNFVFGLAACLALSGFVKADVIFDNLNATPVGLTTFQATTTNWNAQNLKFTSGPDMTIGQVVLRLQGVSGSTASNAVVQLFTGSNTTPGSSVATASYTSGTISTGSFSEVTFDFTASNYNLIANNDYWIVLSTSANAINWGFLDSNTPPANAGIAYQIANTTTANSGSTWGSVAGRPFYLKVNATAVPEPGTLLLGSLAALSGGTGAWWKRRKRKAAEQPATV